jgi:hypothetical protein
MKSKPEWWASWCEYISLLDKGRTRQARRLVLQHKDRKVRGDMTFGAMADIANVLRREKGAHYNRSLGCFT